MAIITTKQIIDVHFNDNYKYYRKVCYRYYSGRFIYEDLLHELYLGFFKVKEDVILQFHNIDKLKNIGLLIIRSLFQKRNQHERTGDSVLLEIKTIESEIDIFYSIGIEDENPEDLIERKKKETQLDRMNALILANKDNEFIQMLITSNNETLIDMAKEGNTTTYVIKQKINKGKQLIKDNL